MRRKFLILAAIAIGGAALGPGARPAPACPGCKLANETVDKRPQAYQASILFMMSMPAIITAAFGVGLYRLSRKAVTEDAEFADRTDGEFVVDRDRPPLDV